MNVTDKQPRDQSLAYVDEDRDESLIGLDNETGDHKQMGQSVILAPSSVQEYLERSLKPSGTVNIPLSAITILLPHDRIIDWLRTVVNIFGNMCGVIVVSESLKEEAEQQA